jgi:hypothetical protein
MTDLLELGGAFSGTDEVQHTHAHTQDCAGALSERLNLKPIKFT